MSKTKGNKKLIIGGVALIAVIAIFAILYNVFGAKPVEGSKSITIEVVDDNGESTMYEIKTDVLYLREAMEEAKGLTFTGAEGEFGLTVETINGVTTDFNNGSYWGFYVNGEYCNYGVETQPVMDGDQFLIEYTVYSAE